MKTIVAIMSILALVACTHRVKPKLFRWTVVPYSAIYCNPSIVDKLGVTAEQAEIVSKEAAAWIEKNHYECTEQDRVADVVLGKGEPPRTQMSIEVDEIHSSEEPLK